MTLLYVGRSSNWVKSGKSSTPFTSERDALVLGAYKPSAATTGVLPGIPRTTVTSASQLPGGGLIGGSTYSNLNFQFIVTPPAGTVPIRFINCLFQGTAAAPTSDVGVVKLFNTGHCPVVAIDCTLAPQTPSRWWNGFHGHDFTALRCDVSRVVDSFSVFNTADPTGPLNVVIQQCWSHDHAWFPNPPETRAPDGSHSDGVQLQSGSGFVFQGNNVEAFCAPDMFNTFYGTHHSNSAMLIKPDVGVITTVDIQFNWFDGGAAGLNIIHDQPDRLLGNIGIIKNNLFGRDIRNGAVWAINKANLAPTISWDNGSGATTNHYADDNSVVPIHLG